MNPNPNANPKLSLTLKKGKKLRKKEKREFSGFELPNTPINDNPTTSSPGPSA